MAKTWPRIHFDALLKHNNISSCPNATVAIYLSNIQIPWNPRRFVVHFAVYVFPFEGGDQTRRSFEGYLGRAMVEQNYQHSFLIWIEGRRDVILENYAFVA